jgi:hypothetical protein
MCTCVRELWLEFESLVHVLLFLVRVQISVWILTWFNRYHCVVFQYSIFSFEWKYVIIFKHKWSVIFHPYFTLYYKSLYERNFVMRTVVKRGLFVYHFARNYLHKINLLNICEMFIFRLTYLASIYIDLFICIYTFFSKINNRTRFRDCFYVYTQYMKMTEASKLPHQKMYWEK